jgi:hypothetical protein
MTARRSSSLLALFVVGCGGKVLFGSNEGGGGAGGTAGSNTGANVSDGGTLVVTNTTEVSTVDVSTGVGLSPVGGGGPGLQEVVLEEDTLGGTLVTETGPGTLGISAVIRSNDGVSEVSVSAARAPSGSSVVSGSNPTNLWEWAWFGAVGMGQPQVEHPETFPLAQGSWQFDFASSGPARASIWRRSTIDGAFHGGVLDVNVFVPDGLVDDGEALQTMQASFGDWAGITLGDVRFFPMSGDFFLIDDSNVFEATALTAQAPNRPALNIVAVGEIGGSFDGAAGFSLGIPGVSLFHGTTSSAVVWQVFYDPFVDSLILRHEAAHFSGLFHTTEISPPLQDPLSDTPYCANLDFENFTNLDQCPDWSHVMFPTGGSGEGVFSPQQQAVLRASTVYRGIFAPGEMPMEPYGPEFDQLQGQQADLRIASDEDFARAATALASRPASQRQDDWGAGLTLSAKRYLEGVGCPSGVPYFDVLRSMVDAGSLDVDTLTELALDPSAPVIARQRAIKLLGRLGPRAIDVPAIRWIVEDEAEPSLVRSAALEWLVASPARDQGRALARELTTSSDRLLVAKAQRLSR